MKKWLLALALALLPSAANAQDWFRNVVLLPAASQSGGTAPCTIFAQDAFSGSANATLVSHTPNIGSSWTEHGSYPAGAFKLDGAGGVYESSGNGALAYNGGTPASADYYVQTVLVFNAGTSGEHGIAGRIATGANTFYYASWLTSSTRWQLVKIVAGSTTSLGTSSDTFTSGTKTLRLTMTGTSISLSVNGSVVVGPISDSAISAAGKSGIYTNALTPGTSSTEIHQSAFVACG